MLINGEKTDPPQRQLEKIILDTRINGDNVRENLAFLFSDVNSKFIRAALHSVIDYPSLTADEWDVIHLIHILSATKSCIFFSIPILDENVVNKFFPIMKTKIMCMPKFEHKFNSLQDASFKAKVTKSPEIFQHFCNEVELIQIASGKSDSHWMLQNLITDEDLYDDVLLEINKYHSLIASTVGFGYKNLTKKQQVIQYNKMGAANFIEMINTRVPPIPSQISNAFESGFQIGSYLKEELSSEDNFETIVNSVKSLNRENINFSTMAFVCVQMLGRGKTFIDNSGLISYMPKYTNKELDFVKKCSNRHLFNVCFALIKTYEIENGFNDIKQEYASNYQVDLEFLNTIFNEDERLEFIQKFWNLSCSNVKQLVTENTLIDVLRYLTSNSTNLFNSSLMKFGNIIISQEIIEPQNFIQRFHTEDESENKIEFLKNCLGDQQVSIQKLLLKFNNCSSLSTSDLSVENIYSFYRNCEELNLSLDEKQSLKQIKEILDIIIRRHANWIKIIDSTNQQLVI